MRSKIERYPEHYSHVRLNQGGPLLKVTRLQPHSHIRQRHSITKSNTVVESSSATETQVPHVKYLVYSILAALAIDIIIIALFGVLLMSLGK